MDKNPKTVNKAVKFVKKHISNSRVIFGKSHAARCAKLAESSGLSDGYSTDEFNVRVAKSESNKQKSLSSAKYAFQTKHSKGETISSKSEIPGKPQDKQAESKLIDLLVEKLTSIEGRITELSKNIRKPAVTFNSRSPTPPPTAIRKEAICFKCGKKGNFSRDCWSKATKDHEKSDTDNQSDLNK